LRIGRDRSGSALAIFRFTQTIAGIAAAARRWEAAEEHFQIAM
jgi:hypothetical protein